MCKVIILQVVSKCLVKNLHLFVKKYLDNVNLLLYFANRNNKQTLDKDNKLNQIHNLNFTIMRATFFSYNDAMNFATENNCQNINEIKKAENIQISCAYSLNSEILKSFCIDEFTEIVPCYIFSEQETYNREKGDYENLWYIDNCILLLKNIITGDLFHIYQTKYNSQKFGLTLFCPSVKKHLDYFTTEWEQPNYIGKPNRKKLQAWFDYLIGVDREKLDYVNRAKCAINAFTEKVLAKFPDATIDKDKEGVTKRIRATWGAIRFTWTPTETGKFYREAYIYNAPSDEELLK